MYGLEGAGVQTAGSTRKPAERERAREAALSAWLEGHPGEENRDWTEGGEAKAVPHCLPCVGDTPRWDAEVWSFLFRGSAEDAPGGLGDWPPHVQSPHL